MKKTLRLALLGMVLLAALAVVVVVFSMNSFIKRGVEQAGSQVAKVPMKLDKASVSLFSGSGGLFGLFIGNPEGFKTDFAIKMTETSVSLKPSSLLSDKIVVKSIHVISPEINLEGGLKGNNLGKIVANLQASLGLDKKSDDPTPAPAASQEPGKKIQVDDFLLSGAKITLSLTELGSKPLSATLPDIHLTGLGQDSQGITPGELALKLIKAILASSTNVANSQLSGLVKGLLDNNKDTTDALQKSTQGLTDLLKKK